MKTPPSDCELTACAMTTLPEEWFPQHSNGEIRPLAQALLYPYPAPLGDYRMRDGLPYPAPEGIPPEELEGLVPVLSVGSNRAPLQLRRKFGPAATLPVTGCQLIDADVVFAASLSFYCAMPATACPSPGTITTLNITWLDEVQLGHMHDTEAVGIAYDFVRLDDSAINHGQRVDAEVFRQPVYGYQARAGVFAGTDGPVAQHAIPARHRRFTASDQREMLTWLHQHHGGDDRSLEDWLAHLRGSRPARDRIIAKLAEQALRPEDPPWQVVAARSQNPENFL